MIRGAAIRARGAVAVLAVLLAAVAAVAGAEPSGGTDPAASRISEELREYGIGPLPGRTSLEVPFEIGGRRVRDVIGYLPGSEGGTPSSVERALLVGTRYADAGPDQAAALLVAAGKLKAASLRHAVIVAFWADGGGPRNDSREFERRSNPTGAKPVACIQLEREGPGTENRLRVLGAASSEVWPGLLERSNVPVGFDLRVVEDPEQPTDLLSFHQAGIPAISLGKAVSADAQAPTGEPAQPDPEEVERLARFVALLVRRLDGLAEAPEFVAPTSRPGKPSPEKQSAYTGTIPDYTADVEGLRLSGVMEDGPAAAAGLAEGDVIVEFDGKRISDIYSYRDALEGVKVGRPIRVVFIRDGERREVTVVPTARP